MPKSVEYLCDVNPHHLHHNDIIQYLEQHGAAPQLDTSELREFLASKMTTYFCFVLELVLALRPSYAKEFYSVLKDILCSAHKMYKPHTGLVLSQHLLDESAGKFAACSAAALKVVHPNYLRLVNHFGGKQGLTIVLGEMLDGKDRHPIQPPATLTHHALMCNVILMVRVSRFMALSTTCV